MKKTILTGFLLLGSILIATAMPTQKIMLQGTIIDATASKALEYATVSAYTLDSLLIEGTITDAQGQFQLNLNKNNYLIKIEFLGFVTQYQQVELAKATNLGVIKLEADPLHLETVEVRAEKSQMNLMLDKKVFNIGQDALSRGGSVNEVLAQLPSITVAPDGTISLRGNSGVNILINGRPSALAANGGLSSISAESIEKVEVITNPSARYEAAGTAGIINIILKKNQSKGYGGTISASTGYRADHNLNANLNWRGKSYSAFANLGGRYSNYFGQSDVNRTSTLPGVAARFDQRKEQNRNDKAFSAYVGMDYSLDDQQTLTATYSLYHMINDDFNTGEYRYLNDQGALTEDWQENLDYLEPGTYHQIDLIYTKTYAKEGRKLTAYFRNDLWNEEESEEIDIQVEFPQQSELLRLLTSSIESSRDHLLQLDYETPLNENGHLELGVRGETRIISADYSAQQSIENVWLSIPEFNNKLDYFERIASAYAQYRYKKDAWGLQLGLRNEYTYVKVETAENTTGDIKKTYNRLFPSMSLSYQIAEGKTTQFSYSRRIRRPSFWQLNPFRGLSDPTTLFLGNPDMDPAYTDRIELNFIQRWEKFSLNPAIYASRTTDYFEVARDQEAENLFGLETGTIIDRPINLEREDRYGVELISSYRPTEALSLTGEFNYYAYQQRGVFGDRNFDFDFQTWTSAMRIQLDLPKDISFQTRLAYQGRFKTVQFLQKSIYTMSASISKQINKKLTLTLGTRSPNWWDVEIFRPAFNLKERGQWTGWRTNFNVQYRFEKGASASSRRGRGSIR